MKILVTGGAGFIGSHIVDALAAEGHSVVVIDNLSSGKKEHVNSKAELVVMDIRDEALGAIFDKHRFDVVFHEAAQMDVRKSVTDPLYDASINVLGTLNLLQNSLRVGAKKFIFASTGGAIYGEQDYFPADEKHPLRPLSPYGITKLAVEKYLFYYYEVHKLTYVSLRYANVYGPRQSPHGEAGVIAIFTEKMLSGGQAVINGDGKQTRDYVYVGDVAKANLLALSYDRPAIFNVGTGVETDVNELFTRLRTITGSKCAEQHAPAKKGEQLRSVIDASSISKTLGWNQSVKLEEGLRQTVEYFKKKT